MVFGRYSKSVNDKTDQTFLFWHSFPILITHVRDIWLDIFSYLVFFIKQRRRVSLDASLFMCFLSFYLLEKATTFINRILSSNQILLSAVANEEERSFFVGWSFVGDLVYYSPRTPHHKWHIFHPRCLTHMHPIPNLAVQIVGYVTWMKDPLGLLDSIMDGHSIWPNVLPTSILVSSVVIRVDFWSNFIRWIWIRWRRFMKMWRIDNDWKILGISISWPFDHWLWYVAFRWETAALNCFFCVDLVDLLQLWTAVDFANGPSQSNYEHFQSMLKLPTKVKIHRGTIIVILFAEEKLLSYLLIVNQIRKGE